MLYKARVYSTSVTTSKSVLFTHENAGIPPQFHVVSAVQVKGRSLMTKYKYHWDVWLLSLDRKENNMNDTRSKNEEKKISPDK
ncbi:hypothetical protein Bpfe_030150, partial [Biomphalaria pfeifferi]